MIKYYIIWGDPLNIPNILTMIRFMLIPVFVYSFFSASENNYIIAAIIFVIAGLTDILDGYIARKYNLVTNWGKLLDPLADKAMQLTVVFCLAYERLLPSWVVLIVLAKELLMVVGGFWLYKKQIIISANWYGKVATVLFYLAILTIIIFDLSEFVRLVIIDIVLVVMIFAFIRYSLCFRGMQQNKEKS